MQTPVQKSNKPTFVAGFLKRNSSLDDYETVDWAQDSHLLNQHRAKLYLSAQGFLGLLQRAYYASQGWLAVIVVGILGGIISAFVDISTAFTTDLKLGFCRPWFWAPKTECCYGIPADQVCTSWTSWSDIHPDASGGLRAFLGYFFYVFFSAVFSASACYMVLAFAPYASGSGIPELKTVLGGFNIKRFLGLWTLLVKTVGLSLSVGSGLAIGKEGPMVHLTCCVGNIVSRLFSKFRVNEGKKRELISASAACGISVAFGAPIGGVLFSLEEASSFFPHKTLWRSFFCTVIGALILRSINPASVGQLTVFQFQFQQSWHYFDIFPFLLLGTLGGILGQLFTSLNIHLARIRRASSIKSHPLAEVVVITIITALINYQNEFLKGSSIESLSQMFTGCKRDNSGSLTCDLDTSGEMFASLLFALVAKFVLMTLSIGIKVPAGLFVPSLCIGAFMGRITGLGMKLLYDANPTASFFNECRKGLSVNSSACIQPGVYALVGAAAMLAGVTRVTVAIVVILFESTSATEYMLPVMFAVMVAKWVGDGFSKDSIYEKYIALAGYPYLDTRTDSIDVQASASDVIGSRAGLAVLSAVDETLETVEALLAQTVFQGFPIVETRANMVLYGYISRSRLDDAIAEAKTRGTASPMTRCMFARGAQALQLGSAYIDFAEFVDKCPISIQVTAPVDRVVDCFKALGVRVVLVVSNSKLAGLITKKDLVSWLENVKDHPEGEIPLRSGAPTPAKNSSSTPSSSSSSTSINQYHGRYNSYQ